MSLGLYFVFLRPPILLEDLRYMGIGSTLDLAAIPGLFRWLDKVFEVLGGFTIAAGLMLAYVLRSETAASSVANSWLLLLSGLSGVVLMSAVNFEIGSDFRWLLVFPAVAWIGGLWFRRS